MQLRVLVLPSSSSVYRPLSTRNPSAGGKNGANAACHACTELVNLIFASKYIVLNYSSKLIKDLYIVSRVTYKMFETIVQSELFI